MLSGAEREERILAHVALYRVTFRRVLERLFFGGREAACANVIDRLLKQRRLCARRVGGGPLKYYQLTPAEAGRRGVPQRALPLGSRALPEAIAVVWFCTIRKQSRHRLEYEELQTTLGAAAPHGPHCVEDGEPPRIYRIYVPGPRTKIAAIAAALEALVENALGQASLATWIRNQLYGVAVLVSTDIREKRVRKAIESRRLREGAHIVIERVPDVLELPRALMGLRHGE